MVTVPEKTCRTCCWSMPDCLVNREIYGDDIEWPICGRRGSGKTGEHIEPTFGCEKYANPAPGPRLAVL